MVPLALIPFVLAGCTDTGVQLRDRDRPFVTPTESSGPTTSDPTSPDPDSSDTGPDEPTEEEEAFDCTTEPVRDTWVSIDLATEEDFDFHPAGMLVTPQGGRIVGLWRDGSQEVLAAGVGFQLSGLRVLVTGADAVVGDQAQGSVELITANGSVLTIQGGLTNPRAVAADSQGYIYVSENAVRGRVRMADPLGGQQWILAEDLDYPNGLALSPDEQTLYVVVGEPFLGEDIQILAAERTGKGTFADPWVLVDLDEAAFSLATDVCGHVYAANFFAGRIYRIAPDGSSIVLIADLPGFCCFSGMRFGNGVGGFDRDHLYVTNRGTVFDLTIGIPGKEPIYPIGP